MDRVAGRDGKGKRGWTSEGKAGGRVHARLQFRYSARIPINDIFTQTGNAGGGSSWILVELRALHFEGSACGALIDSITS